MKTNTSSLWILPAVVLTTVNGFGRSLFDTKKGSRVNVAHPRNEQVVVLSASSIDTETTTTTTTTAAAQQQQQPPISLSTKELEQHGLFLDESEIYEATLESMQGHDSLLVDMEENAIVEAQDVFLQGLKSMDSSFTAGAETNKDHDDDDDDVEDDVEDSMTAMIKEELVLNHDSTMEIPIEDTIEDFDDNVGGDTTSVYLDEQYQHTVEDIKNDHHDLTEARQLLSDIAEAKKELAAIVADNGKEEQESTAATTTTTMSSSSSTKSQTNQVRTSPSFFATLSAAAAATSKRKEELLSTMNLEELDASPPLPKVKARTPFWKNMDVPDISQHLFQAVTPQENPLHKDVNDLVYCTATYTVMAALSTTKTLAMVTQAIMDVAADEEVKEFASRTRKAATHQKDIGQTLESAASAFGSMVQCLKASDSTMYALEGLKETSQSVVTAVTALGVLGVKQVVHTKDVLDKAQAERMEQQRIQAEQERVQQKERLEQERLQEQERLETLRKEQEELRIAAERRIDEKRIETEQHLKKQLVIQLEQIKNDALAEKQNLIHQVPLAFGNTPENKKKNNQHDVSSFRDDGVTTTVAVTTRNEPMFFATNSDNENKSPATAAVGNAPVGETMFFAKNME